MKSRMSSNLFLRKVVAVRTRTSGDRHEGHLLDGTAVVQEGWSKAR